jgi:glutathione S-transferase
MLTVFGDPISGNCYKVKLLLTQLGRPFDWVDVDVVKGETRTPEFLAMNPTGKVPLLQIEPGKWLAESNAILCYLADGTPYLPEDRLARAEVLQWLFWEQYSHEPYIATFRFWIRYLDRAESYRAKVEGKQPNGYAALDRMEGELRRRNWIAGEHYTIADIALYAYTHVAEEGDFDLGRYPEIRAWFKRVEAQPGYVPMYQGVALNGY